MELTNFVFKEYAYTVTDTSFELEICDLEIANQILTLVSKFYQDFSVFANKENPSEILCYDLKKLNNLP